VTWDLFSSAEAIAREEEEARMRSAARVEGAPARARPAPRGASKPGSLLAENEKLARGVVEQELEREPAVEGRAAEWAVSEVNALARRVIEGALPPFCVVGEITNFTRARSGHCYFSLRDDRAQLRCVMWRDEARRLPTTPAEGMEVRAFGRLTLYEARGEFQLAVSVLEGRGEGLWKLAFDGLRAKLEAEGLTAPGRKRPIPRFPSCVGVVTSAEGAALRDVITVIRKRAPWTQIVLTSCRVQGEGAAADIARAIERIGRAGCADVLIVGRGGGSVEDLWAFNEEVVARAIAAAPVPVISAVGHETDVTIADLVADLRAPTPSAAAEAAVPDRADLRRRLLELDRCLQAAARERIVTGRDQLAGIRTEMQTRLTRRLRAHREQLRAAAAHLNALSPLATMARGFAVPLATDGTLLRGIADFPPGREFQLRVVDGSVPSLVRGAPQAFDGPHDTVAG
jgi:exodeoxyribonuclease VII large subunit